MELLSTFAMLAESSSEEGESFITLLVLLAIVFAAGILGAAFYWKVLRSPRLRRSLWFKSPFSESGRTGALADLRPVEAGLVMSVDIPRIIAMYILDLSACGDIKITGLGPLRIEVQAAGELPDFTKRFLDALKEDGSLDREKILESLDFLFAGLKRRIGKHCVKDTVMFYLEKVDWLWKKLSSGGSGEGSIASLTEDFPWLLLHEGAEDRLIELFEGTKRWPAVQPVVKLSELVKNKILTNEDLLRHAAYHKEGIFENDKYRSAVMEWARFYLQSRTILPAYLEPSLRKTAEEAQKKREKHMDEIQRLYEMAKNH